MGDRRERHRRIEALRTIPLVAACSDRQLRAVDQLGARIHVAAGTELTREGTAGRECFVVLGGAAIASGHGRDLGNIEFGSVAGEMALLHKAPRMATVVADTPMHLLVLTPDELARLFLVAPNVEEEFAQIAAERRAALADRAAGSRRTSAPTGRPGPGTPTITKSGG